MIEIDLILQKENKPHNQRGRLSQKYGCLSGYWRRSLYLYAWPGRGRRAGPAAKREVGRWLWRLKTRNAIRELQISTARLLSLKYLVGSVECGVCSPDGTRTRSSERVGKCEMGSPKAKRL